MEQDSGPTFAECKSRNDAGRDTLWISIETSIATTPTKQTPRETQQAAETWNPKRHGEARKQKRRGTSSGGIRACFTP
jgi:hypothetical protein